MPFPGPAYFPPGIRGPSHPLKDTGPNLGGDKFPARVPCDPDVWPTSTEPERQISETETSDRDPAEFRSGNFLGGDFRTLGR